MKTLQNLSLVSYRVFDNDGDGVVSLSQLETILCKMGNSPLVKEDAKEAIKERRSSF